MKNIKLISQQICLLLVIVFAAGQVFGQADSISSVVISDFQVSEIINNPETMEVEGYFLEFNVSSSEILSNLTFEIESPNENEEVELTQYQLEILVKENGIYLVIQNNHFLVKNGIVQMHFTVEPISLNEKTVYKLSGLDKQGINTNRAEFSQIQ